MASRTVLITGANRGIGLAILQVFAQRAPTDHFLLGCRRPTDGAAAIQKLRSLGIESRIDVVELDVTSDESIRAAEALVRSKFGKLDVLINNAGISQEPQAADGSDLRAAYNANYNTNVSSVAVATTVFLPLLRETTTGDARVINVSSTTGSFGGAGRFPSVPPAIIPYIATKSALNMLTLALAKGPGNERVLFQSAGPGLCRTDLNQTARTRPGARDPLDGARVYVELALADRDKYQNAGFWYMGDDDKEAVTFPW